MSLVIFEFTNEHHVYIYIIFKFMLLHFKKSAYSASNLDAESLY